MKSVTVLTPTVGSDKLLDAVKSVQAQTYPNVIHHMVVDGAEHNAKINKMLLYHGITQKMTVDFLTNNVGKNNFYGHRIYAAFAHLINTDYICFLDEDNWYQPDHVEKLVATIEQHNLDLAYSLRAIYSAEGEYLVDDNCESLGEWPISFSGQSQLNQPQFLVDTSSYCFTNNFLVRSSALWHNQWGADRIYFNAIKDKARHKNSKARTLCYRLDGNPNSVNRDFFVQGNEINMRRYQGKLPWIQ